LSASRVQAGGLSKPTSRLSSGQRSPARDRLVYETVIRNDCDEPIEITRFAAYRREGGVWRLSTIANGLFTAEQFREWYGVEGGWIEPHRSASDPENYGPDALWVYFYRTKSGRTGKASGRSPGARRLRTA
jgi:hypothetical protein